MTQAYNNSNLDDELLSAYIDGELTEAERTAVEARLETDPAARELVAEMRSVSDTVKSLPREALAKDLRGAVLSQIGASQVSLPRAEISMAHRLMWPALAIAAALLLMFIQGNEKPSEGDTVARVDRHAGESRERAFAGDRDLAFDAPSEESSRLGAASEPAAPALVPDSPTTVAESSVPSATATAGTVLGESIESPATAARRVTEAMAGSDAELEGVVHLTLTDFRTGAERFNQLLVSNGVQLVDEQAAAGEPAALAAPATAAQDAISLGTAGRVGDTMSTRSAVPMGGIGGGRSSNAPREEGLDANAEPEMVLVEAPPQQIEQIILGCAQDTEAIEGVAVDPTASGMNTVPAKQRLSDYQQYSRAPGKLSQGSEYTVTPEQQNAIAVFNSVPKEEEPSENAENQQQRGWAARFYAGQQPVQNEQLNWQYNRYRDQYFDNQLRQQSVAKGGHAEMAKNLAKDKSSVEQPLRVLFLLHPSQEPTKK